MGASEPTKTLEGLTLTQKFLPANAAPEYNSSVTNLFTINRLLMLIPLAWISMVQGQIAPSISLPDGTRITFKSFTQGRELKPKSKGSRNRYEHPQIGTTGSTTAKTSTWSSKYLMAFDLAEGAKMDDWRVIAFDDDGYGCEVQPMIMAEKTSFCLLDPLPIGSKKITLRFESKDREEKPLSKPDQSLVMPIENPFFVIPQSIKPQPLPQSRQCFGQQVTLTEAVRRRSPTGGVQYPLELTYSVTENGNASNAVEFSKVVIEDGYGLQYEKKVGGRQSRAGETRIGIRHDVPWRSSLEWKVQLHLSRTLNSEAFTQTERYEVRRLPLLSTELLKVGTADSVCGPVEVRIENGNSLCVDRLVSLNQAKQLILLSAQDDQGRTVESTGLHESSEVIEWPRAGVEGRVRFHTKIALDAKHDAKWLDVVFAFHKPDMIEFTVRPKFIE